MKRWLRAQPLAKDIDGLQTQLDAFLLYYNHERPHRALHGATPFEAWQATEPARPGEAKTGIERTKLATIDRYGRIMVGRSSIQVDYRRRGEQVLVIASGLEVTIIGGGQVIRRLTIDPNRRYQPNGQPTGRRRRQIGPCS